MIRSTVAAQPFLLMMLVFAVATRAAEAPQAVALVRTDYRQLEWTPLGDFESITLALSDPQGMVRTHRFGPGEAPALSLFDAQGAPLPDGTYTWELRFTPHRRAGRPTTPWAQSGYFTIADGNLVPFDLIEPPEKIITSEDQMVPDDLIVDGKGCVGLGCANNEAFGSEALRLKQSVVRLRFEDTSTAAGLPTRDWQLTVNDSTSGGADRFSLDDLTAGTTPLTVRGGAPSNSLYVDGVGRVGIGTAAPSALLMVQGSAFADAVMRVRNLQSPGYSGIEFINHLGTPGFFFGVNNSNNTTRLNSFNNFPFLLMTNSVERIRIEPDGDVGIGCNDPGSDLVIGAGAGASCTTAPFSSINAGSTSFTASSSRALKENLSAIEVPDILDRISRIGVYTYDFINGPKSSIGLIAEDFHQIFQRGSDKLLNGQEVEMALWLAVQELAEENRQERQHSRELEERNSELERRISRLEAILADR